MVLAQHLVPPTVKPTMAMAVDAITTVDVTTTADATTTVAVAVAVDVDANNEK